MDRYATQCPLHVLDGLNVPSVWADRKVVEPVGGGANRSGSLVVPTELLTLQFCYDGEIDRPCLVVRRAIRDDFGPAVKGDERHELRTTETRR